MGDSKLAKWFIRAELRALRTMAGLTENQLAGEIGFTGQAIVYWEQGKHVPRRSIVKDICGIAGVEQSRTDFLLLVVDNYKQEDLVANLATHNVRILEQAERTAGYLFKFELNHIPGPLQLPGYHSEMLHKPDPESLRRKIKRGQIMEGRKDNPRVEILIGYNALRHLRLMTHWDRQIERILKAAELPNWEIRVIDGLHRGSKGSFDFYKPDNASEAGPAFVYTEALDQSRYIEEVDTLRWYDRLRSDIWDLGEPIKETFSDGIQLLA